MMHARSFVGSVPMLVVLVSMLCGGDHVAAQGKTYETHNTTAILKITFAGDEGLQSAGTCVAVDEYHVLTAAHVVGSSTGSIAVKSGTIRARLIAIDFYHDRALLRATDRITEKPRAFRETALNNGESLWAIGFGGRGFGYTRCRADGKQIRGRAVEGDSGGPVCDADGRIVGLIKGYSADGFLMSVGRASLAKWTRDNLNGDPIDVGP